MSQRYTHNGVEIYLHPIDGNANGNRREHEISAVRSILADLGLSPDKLCHDQEGAPHIEGYHVSITHSRRLAVVALSKDVKIGIDAEEWRPALKRVKKRFLSVEEDGYITDDASLLKAWTIKEAVYKAAGKGAYNFSDAISIAPNMRSAAACGKTFEIFTFKVNDTTITLVTEHTSQS